MITIQVLLIQDDEPTNCTKIKSSVDLKKIARGHEIRDELGVCKQGLDLSRPS